MLQLPKRSFRVIQSFLKSHELLVYHYMVLSIQKAIRENLDKTELFTFGGNNENIAMVRRQDYEKILNDAIGHFSHAEDYERAGLSRNVLDQWKIAELINEKPKR